MEEDGLGTHHNTGSPLKGRNTLPTPHPLPLYKDLEECRVSGGSSGGSAVAVATGACLAAIGSDTGGSVRLPAAYTGTVGFKPSYGWTSRAGLVAYASSLDTPGVFSQTVRDAAIVAETMRGPDLQHDATSFAAVPPFVFDDTKGIGSLRIGIPKEYHIDELEPHIATHWEHAARGLAQNGATIQSVSLPLTRVGLPCYYILAAAEASSNLARYDGVEVGPRLEPGSNVSFERALTDTRTKKFGLEVRRRIVAGTFVLSRDSYDSYYVQAQRTRQLVIEDFERVFADDQDGVDVLLCPTAPTCAPKLRDARHHDPVASYANDVFTVPASLAGLPTVSVNAAQPGDLPVGLQLIGARGTESKLLLVASALEALRVKQAKQAAV
eukprot:m.93585 g.93585  ORF g.93585 m.93585 type:complete len:382 (-) comp15096_c0_seq7:315-1460(-)